ncbi:UPF0146 family protein [Halococcus thailandensis]|uniref:Uncharacterized protein n=1 Tax=Halococcus thailandensis JCM 13552 TaxID=1227457 RepID=M0NAD9_9EURY|nr:UPF0146 family protein [Halococcus thailandensis]EMA54049.1 hypothetical protein C451_07257 [Halococcus thailandensis JCM 13552]
MARADALADRLADFASPVEVGIGARTDVAARLADETAVTATDVRPCTVPDDVTFVQDDITDPAMDVYADADALYALNLPRELHRPTRAVARAVGAVFRFTTLGSEFPAVTTEAETLPAGETLFRATDRGGEPA